MCGWRRPVHFVVMRVYQIQMDGSCPPVTRSRGKPRKIKEKLLIIT